MKGEGQAPKDYLVTLNTDAPDDVTTTPNPAIARLGQGLILSASVSLPA